MNKTIILSVLLLLSIRGIAQQTSNDYIVKKSGDTIRCKITEATKGYINYNIDNSSRVINRRDVRTFYQDPKNVEMQIVKSELIKTDSFYLPKYRPGIALVWDRTSNMDAKGRTTGTTVTLKGFRVDRKEYKMRRYWGTDYDRLGWRDRNIKPYLKMDREAMSIYRLSRVVRDVKKPIFWGSLYILSIGIFSDELMDNSNNGGNDETIPYIVGGCSGLLVSYLFHVFGRNFLIPKAVKKYNKNSINYSK